MRQTDLHTAAAQLRDAFDELQIAWREVNEEWDDQVSRRFCERHLEPIAPVMKKTLDAIGHMSQIHHQIRRDCEE